MKENKEKGKMQRLHKLSHSQISNVKIPEKNKKTIQKRPRQIIH